MSGCQRSCARAPEHSSGMSAKQITSFRPRSQSNATDRLVITQVVHEEKRQGNLKTSMCTFPASSFQLQIASPMSTFPVSSFLSPRECISLNNETFKGPIYCFFKNRHVLPQTRSATEHTKSCIQSMRKRRQLDGARQRGFFWALNTWCLEHTAYCGA